MAVGNERQYIVGRSQSAASADRGFDCILPPFDWSGPSVCHVHLNLDANNLYSLLVLPFLQVIEASCGRNPIGYGDGTQL
jgi:hypothetical protein